MKIHKDDVVQVTAGKDKGKKGKVLKVFPSNEKVLVEGVNIYSKHIKKRGERSGEKVMKERPLPTANVSIINPETGKVDRIGYMIDKAGNKVRMFKKTKKAI